ncbi:MAG: hypothetical protein JOZ98_00485 [Solirubrobacterales bacterium]|nr:hypothetical protein [Solirubrobacterales bacterium]MBV9798033.1 hypothetical protein [Solirubrobacterales bacterium]
MDVSPAQQVFSPPLSGRRGARQGRLIGPALMAWWQAAALDRQLAAGTSPQANSVLAARARRITARRSRKRLADGLTGALRSARDGTPGFTAAIRPHAQEVLAARTVIAALDRRLRGPEPVTAHGTAMLLALMTEGTSPLYRPPEPGALGSHLRAAAAALEPTRS